MPWSGSSATGATTIAVMAEAAAERLHNTPAIARKSFHSRVIGLAETDTRDGLETDTPGLLPRGEAAPHKLRRA